MPALVACGRIWEFGSDDIFFPGIISLIVRIIWFFGLVGGVSFFHDALACESMHYLSGFSISLIVITLMGIANEIAITVISARGSIIRTKPRDYIVHLLYVRILVLILELVLLIIGTVLTFNSVEESSHLDCPRLRTAIIMVQFVLAAYWLVFFILIIIAIVYLDPCHCYSAKVNYSQVITRLQRGDVDEEVVETQWRLVHTVWEKRFKVACCLAGSDDIHQYAYREVAELFAHFFCDTNVVISDIVAGLVLLQKQHIALEEDRRRYMHRENVSTDRESSLSFDFHHEADRDLFKDGVYFLKYAIGMYSWLVYVYMNPFCGFCRLYKKIDFRGRHGNPPNVHNDNKCFCHVKGLQQMTELDDMDIEYLSFENDVYKVPFIVCLDHATKSVVIAFRGTLSFGDIVTDLTASTKPISLPHFPDFLVHSGMLKTVNSTLEKMEKDQILESAFSKVSSDYKLVIVGHSLGSGCACIMSILLREKYPDLRCFCFSPTGALLNEAAAIYTEDFVTSYTLGKDMVARFNARNAHHLKDDLVRVIESCQKPKCRILLEGCFETLSTCFGGSVVFDEAGRPQEVSGQVGVTTTSPSISVEVPEEETNAEEDENENFDSSESNPLITSIEIDPEESLPPSFHISPNLTSSRIERNSTPPHHSPTSNGYETEMNEITPILHPKLSSLKLPVRSLGRTRSRSQSPVNSITRTQEVERRLIPLYPPGKIIHIVDTSKSKPCFCAWRQLEVRWASREDFNHISVSPDMVRDHFPDVIFRAMHKVWKKNLADRENSATRNRYRTASSEIL